MTAYPRFIVLEGGEGAGKSTLLATLAERLRARGHEVVTTREPGGTGAGELIRELLRQKLTPWAETFAFLAARAQVVSEVIRPALDRGAFVICDRFAASTFAYQGHARGLDMETIRAANDAATGGLAPGLTLFLDLDPAVGLRRKHGEQDAIHVGNESLAFHERVREGYRAQMADAAPGSWLRIDASLAADEVAEQAWGAVARHGIRSM